MKKPVSDTMNAHTATTLLSGGARGGVSFVDGSAEASAAACARSQSGLRRARGGRARSCAGTAGRSSPTRASRRPTGCRRRAPRARRLRTTFAHEHEDRHAHDEGADRRRHVERAPARKVGVGEHAAGHPHDAEEVLDEEGQVEAEDREPEVGSAPALVEEAAAHLRKPVVGAGEDRERRAAEEHVVEVRDEVVRVGHLPVDRRGREGDPAQTADDELDEERGGEQHRRREADRRRPTSSRSS